MATRARRYAIYDSGTSYYMVTCGSYDVESAARKILDAGLPPILADRLSVGNKVSALTPPAPGVVIMRATAPLGSGRIRGPRPPLIQTLVEPHRAEPEDQRAVDQHGQDLRPQHRHADAFKNTPRTISMK